MTIAYSQAELTDAFKIAQYDKLCQYLANEMTLTDVTDFGELEASCIFEVTEDGLYVVAEVDSFGDTIGFTADVNLDGREYEQPGFINTEARPNSS